MCFPLIFVVQEIKVKYILGLDMNDDKKKEWDVKYTPVVVIHMYQGKGK